MLAEQLRVNPPHPFEKIEVMVNTWPTSRWLGEQIAINNGISALIDFPFPNSHLKKFIQIPLGIEITNDDNWKSNKLVWTIIKLLPEFLEYKEARHLKDWLKKETSSNNKINKKQWELAKIITNTFEEYFLYRPEFICKWWELNPVTNNSIKDLPNEVQWQPILLNLLKKNINSEPVTLQIKNVINMLKQNKNSLNRFDLPKQLRIFGISSLAPIQIELIQALSSVVDVKIYLLTPCQDLWKRCKDRRKALGYAWKAPIEGSWLLKAPRLEANLGRMGAEFQQLLEGSGEYQLGEFKEEDLFARPVKIAQNNGEEPTLLEQLQESLIENNPNWKLHRNITDNSLMFMPCPGQRRQIQLIRDQIIQWLAEDESLQPRDILIMTPQIEKLAPLVGSIFNDVVATKVNLPWKITDRTQLEKPGLIEFILELFNIASGRLTSINLDQLLSNQVIQSQFNFSQEDLDKMIDCLQQTGFISGVDENERNGDKTHSLSWCLERWLIGLVLPSRPGIAPNNIAPFSPIFSIDEISKWWGILSQICKYLQEMRCPRNCTEWVKLLKLIVLDCFSGEGDWIWERELFHSLLNDWQKDVGECELEIETSIVKNIIQESLSLESGRFGHRSGKITISALEPMRAIPHKAIIIMGVDESIFPQNKYRPGFNLLEHKRLLGDPKPNEQDRYALLEALMSCRQKLLITWNSRDEKSGERLAPPAPIQQWIDYLSTELDENNLTGLINTPSPNPLSVKNFLSINSRPPISCDNRYLEAKLRVDKLPIPKPIALAIPLKWPKSLPIDNNSLDNETISKWLIAPQVIWLNQIQINPKERFNTINILEKFELNELQRYKLIKNQFNEDSYSKLNATEDWDMILKGQGVLPPNTAAEIESQILNTRSKSLASVINNLGETTEKQLLMKKERIEIILAGKTHLIVEIGRVKAKSIMKTWLKHLQVCTYDSIPRDTLLIARANSNNKQNLYEISAKIKAIPQEKAKEILKAIESLVEIGLKECWPVPPESGWQLSKARYYKKTNADNYFSRSWNGGFKLMGEKDKPEMEICFGENCNAEFFLEDQLFNECLSTLYHPLLDNCFLNNI